MVRSIAEIEYLKCTKLPKVPKIMGICLIELIAAKSRSHN